MTQDQQDQQDEDDLRAFASTLFAGKQASGLFANTNDD